MNLSSGGTAGRFIFHLAPGHDIRIEDRAQQSHRCHPNRSFEERQPSGEISYNELDSLRNADRVEQEREGWFERDKFPPSDLRTASLRRPGWASQPADRPPIDLPQRQARSRLRAVRLLKRRHQREATPHCSLTLPKAAALCAHRCRSELLLS